MVTKKKIAIITHYCGSVNYGGNLQAYALPFFLNKNGFDAKQISYPVTKDTSGLTKIEILKQRLKGSPFKAFKSICGTMLRSLNGFVHVRRKKQIAMIHKKRFESFKHFQLEMIPHTNKEYLDESLKDLNQFFDFFITGSDQVFNFNMAKYGYFLTFVKDKPKMSYAASMALDSIPENKKAFMKDALKDYQAIGVREEKTVGLLEELIDKKVELNIDPVFLLEREDWDAVASKRLVDEEYVFCYFLGNNQIEREEAKAFSKAMGLKLVCIPFYKTRYRHYDLNFGDINLPYASPEDFISLIKHAKYIFTDSFHACALSIIYQKQFIVFNRDKLGSMNSRIKSLVSTFDCEERFFEENTGDLEKTKAILQSKTEFLTDKFVMLKTSSINYLLGNLSKLDQ